MMGRLNHDQRQLFYSFSLEEAAPDDHLVRKIAAVLDLSWLHAELAPHYPNTGRPSIDPELMIRMLIIGHVFAIRSERALCRDECHRPGACKKSTHGRLFTRAISIPVTCVMG
jgi:transposase